MKTSVIICKIFCIHYLIACIGAEIWYLITLHKIRDYRGHGVGLDYFAIIYPDVFFFFGYLFLIIKPYCTQNNWDGLLKYLGWIFGVQLLILHAGIRYIVTFTNLGKIPFNCEVGYDLPDNVKIACKARFISCILYFSSFAIPVLPFLGWTLYHLFGGIFNRIINSLQRNLLVL